MKSESNNKKIAKNALFLYIRMGIMMLISLYTSRVVLNTLGVEDYGIYNVVGGITMSLVFLTSSLSIASQRFISFELGKGDENAAQRVFCMSLNCLLLAAVFLIIIFETLGLWFLNTQLSIPEGRMNAANWVYQISILSFTIGIINVPYNATIVSYERMSFYAYISILKAILLLLIVYLLLVSSFDKLIMYACLTLLVHSLIFLIYYIYCKKKFSVCKYRLFWDKNLFKQLTGFTGWSMFNAFSNLSIQQATNFLINIFIGVVGNAAIGLANSVSAAINQFVGNFQTAFRPSIIKLYASGRMEELNRLIFRAASFSYYLLLVIAIPIIFNMEPILKLWLGNVPQYVSGLCILFISYYFIDALQAPLWILISASGNIRTHSLFSGILYILNLPFSWVLLAMGFSIYWVVGVRVLLNLVIAIIRTIYVGHVLGFPSFEYLQVVISKIFIVTLFIILGCYTMQNCIFNGHGLHILQILIYFVTACIIILIFGLTKKERIYLMNIAKSKISRKKKL